MRVREDGHLGIGHIATAPRAFPKALSLYPFGGTKRITGTIPQRLIPNGGQKSNGSIFS